MFAFEFAVEGVPPLVGMLAVLVAVLAAVLARSSGEDTWASAGGRSQEKSAFGLGQDCGSTVVGLAGEPEGVAHEPVVARSVREILGWRVEKTQSSPRTLEERQLHCQAWEACMLVGAGRADDRLEAPRSSGVAQKRRRCCGRRRG